jgi:uncharacterized protein (TIGR02001 family)
MIILYQSNLLPQLLCAILVLPYAGKIFADIHGAASVTSNYVGRGYSKSNDQFSYQANIDYEHKAGAYLGASMATVDFGDEGFADAARFEITPYLGWSFSLSENWRLDTQWSHYIYDGDIYGISSDYNEFYLFLHYRDIISLAVSFSEDYYDRGHPAGLFEMTGRYPITDFLEFSGSTGYTRTRKSIDYDYFYWNAGVTGFYKFVTLDLRYADAITTASSHSHGDADYTSYYPEVLSATLFFSVAIGF